MYHYLQLKDKKKSFAKLFLLLINLKTPKKCIGETNISYNPIQHVSIRKYYTF